MQETLKTDQLSSHIYIKLTQIVQATRATEPAHKQPTDTVEDKWFNLSTPCSNLLTGDVRLTYLTISSFLATNCAPPPLELQVLLVVPERMALNKALCYRSKTGFLSEIPLVSGAHNSILLETHTLTFLPNDPNISPAPLVHLADMYKHGVILFRSLFSLLHVLPTWSLRRRLRRLRSRSHGLDMVVRLKDPPTRQTESSSRNVPLFFMSQTESHTLGSIAHPGGVLTLTTTHLSSTDFSIVEKEGLLSTMICDPSELPVPTTPEPIDNHSLPIPLPDSPYVSRRPSGSFHARKSISANSDSLHSLPTVRTRPSSRLSGNSGSQATTRSSSLRSSITFIHRPRSYSSTRTFEAPKLTLDIAFGKPADRRVQIPLVHSLSMSCVADPQSVPNPASSRPAVSLSKSLSSLSPLLKHAVDYVSSSPKSKFSHDALLSTASSMDVSKNRSISGVDWTKCLVFRKSLAFFQSVLSQGHRDGCEYLQVLTICQHLAMQDELTAVLRDCRTIIINMDKIALHAHVLPSLFQDVIHQDWIEITQHLSSFTDAAFLHSISQLEDLDVKELRDSLQMILDRMPLLDLPHSSELDNKVRKLIFRLSKKTSSLPSSLFIEDVTPPVGEAVFGGTFGDIYRTTYQGMDVALKRIRMFRRDSDHLRTWEIEEIAKGLEYLHSRGIAHGDLRGTNILVDSYHCTKLADFGLAVFSDATAATSSVTQGGSVRWMAPELLLPEQFGMESFHRSHASDMYSYACVIYELHTRQIPWQGIQRDAQVVIKVAAGERMGRPSCFPDDLWAIVELCWTHVPSERLNATQVIKLLQGHSSQPYA